MKPAWILSLLLLLPLLATAQDDEPMRVQEVLPITDDLSPGEQAARKHCQSCHLFPQPSLLDQATWRHYVLPDMGYRFGFPSLPEDDLGFRGRFPKHEISKKRVKKAGIFPEQPTIPKGDWEVIQKYYLAHAPEKLVAAKNETRASTGPLPFNPSPSPPVKAPMTSLVELDANSRDLFVADARTRALTVVNGSSGQIGHITLSGVAVDVQVTTNGFRLLQIGSILADDRLDGKVTEISWDEKEERYQERTLVDSLGRPTSMQEADINGDGRKDLVITEFGFRLGGLSWFERNADGTYLRRTINQQVGMIKSLVRDLDADGDPDVIALSGQGREGVTVYYNQGGGVFRESYEIQLPPAYGCADMTPCDINRDGAMDLLIACGDGADFMGSVLHKPYHGLYLYINDGANHFEQKWFYPMPGAYGAVVEDFDKDGDFDIAAISYFPEYDKAENAQAFVYLESQGGTLFTSSTFKHQHVGRWLRIVSGDIDGDGDVDLALGSMTPGPSSIPIARFKQWSTAAPAFALLLNKHK